MNCFAGFVVTIHTSCDTKTGHEIVGNCPDSSLDLQRSRVCSNQAIDRNANDERNIKPVNMLEPVGLGDRLLGDVRLLRVELARRRLRHARWLLSLRGHGV